MNLLSNPSTSCQQNKGLKKHITPIFLYENNKNVIYKLVEKLTLIFIFKYRLATQSALKTTPLPRNHTHTYSHTPAKSAHF